MRNTIRVLMANKKYDVNIHSTTENILCTFQIFGILISQFIIIFSLFWYLVIKII